MITLDDDGDEKQKGKGKEQERGRPRTLLKRTGLPNKNLVRGGAFIIDPKSYQHSVVDGRERERIKSVSVKKCSL